MSKSDISKEKIDNYALLTHICGGLSFVLIIASILIKTSSFFTALILTSGIILAVSAGVFGVKWHAAIGKIEEE